GETGSGGTWAKGFEGSCADSVEGTAAGRPHSGGRAAWRGRKDCSCDSCDRHEEGKHCREAGSRTRRVAAKHGGGGGGAVRGGQNPPFSPTRDAAGKKRGPSSPPRYTCS